MSKIGILRNHFAFSHVLRRPLRFLRRRAHPQRRRRIHAQVYLFRPAPTPFGLVRGGVPGAPDHPKIKSVIRVSKKRLPARVFPLLRQRARSVTTSRSRRLELLYHRSSSRSLCETDRCARGPR